MNNSRPVIWVLKKIRNRIPAIIVMTAAHILQAVFGVLFALGTKAVIDSAVSADPEGFFNACIIQGGIILMILFSVTLYRHLKERLMADLDRDWKKSILHGLLHGEYEAVSAYHSAELLNRLNNDVKIIDDSILTLLPGVTSMLTRIVMAAIVLTSLDPLFTAVIIAVGVAVVLATGLLRKKLKEMQKAVSRMDGKVSGFIQEIIEKLLMVQAMDVSDEVEARADQLMESRYTLQRKRKNISLAANTAVSTMYYGAGFFALLWCSVRLLNGQMSFGSLTAVTQLVNQLQSPFVNLSNIVPRYIAMLASAERLMELEEIQGQTEADLQDTKNVYKNIMSIEGRNISFSYNRDIILENADFSLPKESFTVITGPSGTGKSTLMKLLLGIYKCSSGELYISDTHKEKLQLNRSTRQLFAYVPQGNLILSGTIRDNICISKPEATENEISRALYIADADEFIKNLPDGLETVLGESGTGLSEGQLQRIAIARAILGGAPILLLDECTSALDEETEKNVLQRIKALDGITCIAVTHRPAAIEICDIQLELKNKKFDTIKKQRCN